MLFPYSADFAYRSQVIKKENNSVLNINASVVYLEIMAATMSLVLTLPLVHNLKIRKLSATFLVKYLRLQSQINSNILVLQIN